MFYFIISVITTILTLIWTESNSAAPLAIVTILANDLIFLELSAAPNALICGKYLVKLWN